MIRRDESLEERASPNLFPNIQAQTKKNGNYQMQEDSLQIIDNLNSSKIANGNNFDSRASVHLTSNTNSMPVKNQAIKMVDQKK